jgi:hypothetical protein
VAECSQKCWRGRRLQRRIFEGKSRRIAHPRLHNLLLSRYTALLNITPPPAAAEKQIAAGLDVGGGHVTGTAPAPGYTFNSGLVAVGSSSTVVKINREINFLLVQ